jgi:hypothetical protein
MTVEFKAKYVPMVPCPSCPGKRTISAQFKGKAPKEERWPRPFLNIEIGFPVQEILKSAEEIKKILYSTKFDFCQILGAFY